MPNAEGRMEKSYYEESYELLRDATLDHLSAFVQPDDVAEEALCIDAIRRAGTALAARTREVEALRAENERLRWELRNAAHTCERWADESRNGGWSTHQVDANRAVANRIYRALAAQEGTNG